MSFPKIIIVSSLLIFGALGMVALFKKDKEKKPILLQAPIEVTLEDEVHAVSPANPLLVQAPVEIKIEPIQRSSEHLPDADRIEELFAVDGAKLPIVETVTYRSRVPWQKGRPAWISDYAAHFSTSRHFIARSLNRKADYFKQDVAEGNHFNVLNPEKNIHFHLLIDTSRSKLWFYYHDVDTDDRVLLKTYQVGLGRLDSSKASGLLTPLGKYSLGSKIAIYKPKMVGFHNGQQTEMIRVFGTRWIPFDKEVGLCTAPAAGFGLHGVPWLPDENGVLRENVESLGKYESDGCVRLATKDIEELFSIIITKPTFVELVKDFYEAKLPGIEKNQYK